MFHAHLASGTIGKQTTLIARVIWNRYYNKDALKFTERLFTAWSFQRTLECYQPIEFVDSLSLSSIFENFCEFLSFLARCGHEILAASCRQRSWQMACLLPVSLLIIWTADRRGQSRCLACRRCMSPVSQTENQPGLVRQSWSVGLVESNIDDEVRGR